MQDWHQTPVSTSVVQIPIENILFPSVTLCPRGRTVVTPDLDAISNSLEGGRGFEKIPKKETLLAAVLDCSFTKNNRETGEVCHRIQVSIIAEI